MKVVFVVGPTASGKSSLAISLAQKFSGAIVNCDSIQLYQKVDIGSAKPTHDEMKMVPHFLFDFVAPPDEITAGEYSRLFFAKLKELEAKFKTVFVVGGTGFYFQAIEKGMFPIGPTDEKIKEQVLIEMAETGGPLRLYQELRARDPQKADKISPNDHYRLGRAIEMIRAHGKSVSEIEEEFRKFQAPFPYPLLKMGIQIDRSHLASRVRLRTQQMLESGWIEEVEDLLSQGLKSWAPLSSVGYREIVQFLEEKSDKNLKNLEDLIVQSTMRLAKKQRTWFARDHEIHWLTSTTGETMLKSAEDLVISDEAGQK